MHSDEQTAEQTWTGWHTNQVPNVRKLLKDVKQTCKQAWRKASVQAASVCTRSTATFVFVVPTGFELRFCKHRLYISNQEASKDPVQRNAHTSTVVFFFSQKVTFYASAVPKYFGIGSSLIRLSDWKNKFSSRALRLESVVPNVFLAEE